MRKIIDPLQTRLFDCYDSVLTDQSRRRLLAGWQGVFRHVILELMPVDAIGGGFDPRLGRPTKELYSMAGLQLIMEFMNWPVEQAVDEYMFNMGIHYALNLEPVAQNISIRTIERYQQQFSRNETAAQIMEDVAVKLIKALGLRIDQQRLDSTHVFSDMASFGRTRLMGVAIKRFLTQVKRHDAQTYESLDRSLRDRYAPGVHQLFGNSKKDGESRRRLRQQVAEDMHLLVKRFADNAHAERDTYKALARIFYEQCDIVEDKAQVKTKTGGNCLQNPSDPDATYDGHKGPGYQTQISETCHPENEVQIITCALPQTAVKSDAASTNDVLDHLDGSGLLPRELFGDTHYCSDENIEDAAQRGIELVGPVHPGNPIAKDVDRLSIDDFNIDETTEEVICCPAGHQPVSSVHDEQTGKTKTIMPISICSQCEYVDECPVEKCQMGYCLQHTAKQRRLDSRRREENTDEFRQRYRIRGGIEGTNSGLKRKTGLGRLRVRGRPRVFNAIYLKITGWNIMRAAACAKIREIVYQRGNIAVLGRVFSHVEAANDAAKHRYGLKTLVAANLQRYEEFEKSNIAA